MPIRRPNWNDCDVEGHMIYGAKLNSDPNRPFENGQSIRANLGGLYVIMIIEKILPNDDFEAKIISCGPGECKLPEDLKRGETVLIDKAHICCR